MFASFNCNDRLVFIVLCIRTDYMLVYMDSLFHRLVSLVGLGWVSFTDNNRHGQALLFSYLIFLDNNLGRKRTGQAQPPSPVPRNHRRDTQDLALLVCQKFGV